MIVHNCSWLAWEKPVTDVTIYTTMMCPYCYRAKALLGKKGVAYKEVHVGMDVDLRREMMARSGGNHTVPQIFIDQTHVGGCDELYAMDARGTLDAALAG